jgi:hypothetical protein
MIHPTLKSTEIFDILTSLRVCCIDPYYIEILKFDINWIPFSKGTTCWKDFFPDTCAFPRERRGGGFYIKTYSMRF